MFNMLVDIFIWTFAIYGFIDVFSDFFWEIVYNIIALCVYISTLFRKIIAKKHS
jgi:hypothetical protein